jgi:hypothetical protein
MEKTTNRRVLFITYYWPPAGGIGVLRCLKIVKYIREFGWEPIVYTVKDAQYPAFDFSNLSQVPDGIEVLKYPAFEPFNLYKKLTGKKKNEPLLNVLTSNSNKTNLLHDLAVWIRSNFFIPDARSFWIKPSVNYLTNYLEDNKIDAIFTDGPPHTNTMIGALLKEKLGIPWLADFQDPWTQVDYYQLLKLTSYADKKHKALEQMVFKHADSISIVSKTWKKDLETIGAKNVSILPWGYDEDDFRDIEELSEYFLISHIGLLGNDRNPTTFFEAVAELIAENAEFEKNIKIDIVGVVDVSVKEAVMKFNLISKINFLNQLSRIEAIKLMKRSQVLLLLLNKAENAMGRIPGKLFEYLACKRPIVCLGPLNSDVEIILKEVNAGLNMEYEDKTKIKNTILSLYDQWDKGSLHCNSIGIEKYSARNIAKEVAEILDYISK